MNLKIINSDTELIISDWMLSEPALERRLGIQERFAKPGGYITGDRETKARNFSVERDIASMTDSEYTSFMSSLVNVFDKTKTPFFLVDTDNDRRVEIELSRITPATKKGLEMKLTPIKLSLIMIESYWEDLTAIESSSGSGGLATGETLIISNTGVVNIYPVITLSPYSNNSAFSLINNTTNDIITIGSTAFVPGTELEIDAQEGTLYLSDGTTRTEISSAIADGSGFFFIAPGDNTISYDSVFGNINITISYRIRYAF